MWSQYFDESEFLCTCGCGMTVRTKLKQMLGAARYASGVPYPITSAARCERHNEEVGGSPTSSHLYGWAVDIGCADSNTRMNIIFGLIMAGFKRIGVSKLGNFIHVDIDPNKPEAFWLY